MRRVRLEDVCYVSSSNLSQKDVIALSGNYPIYGASGFIKNINFYKCEKDYIAIVKDGSGIGRTMILPGKSSVIGTMQYIFPKNNINIKYLYYVLKSMNLAKYQTGIAIPHIYFRDYKNEQFCLHSNIDQKNIVFKLDKVQEIIDIREKQIEYLDELIKSQFIEMFENEKYPKKSLIDVCEELFAGGDVKKEHTSKERTDKYKYPIYTNGEKLDGLYGYTDIVRVHKEAVTISGRGTIGFSCIRKEPFYPAVRLIVAVPNKNIIDTIFLRQFIENKNYGGQGASIPQLTVPMIKNELIPIPPIDLQNKFAEFVKQINKQKIEIQKSLKNTQKLQKILMDKYFG